MKKLLSLLICLTIPFTSVACSSFNTTLSRGLNNVSGTDATVVCYSGDSVIYNDKSTGKVVSESNSDGYAFVEKSSGKLVEVSGNCIIKY